MLQPLFDGILFVFVDEIKKGFFHENTDWGFEVLGSSDNSAKSGRWGKVLAIGPDISDDDVKNGSLIFVEPLMWTKGVKHDDVEVWKTDISKVLAIAE